ncbi:hypothetical protein K439DRAFT_591248 [Ramaria rubella]|nr:hypothetical protein K439DRAFT_591248 [Ramaria rubella]
MWWLSQVTSHWAGILSSVIHTGTWGCTITSLQLLRLRPHNAHSLYLSILSPYPQHPHQNDPPKVTCRDCLCLCQPTTRDVQVEFDRWTIGVVQIQVGESGKSYFCVCVRFLFFFSLFLCCLLFHLSTHTSILRVNIPLIPTCAAPLSSQCLWPLHASLTEFTVGVIVVRVGM